MEFFCRYVQYLQVQTVKMRWETRFFHTNTPKKLVCKRRFYFKFYMISFCLQPRFCISTLVLVFLVHALCIFSVVYLFRVCRICNFFYFVSGSGHTFKQRFYVGGGIRCAGANDLFQDHPPSTSRSREAGRAQVFTR